MSTIATGLKEEVTKAGSEQSAKQPSAIFTVADAELAAKLIDKIVVYALQDAVTAIVQPAIQRALLQGLRELTNVAAKKPGGGQDGGGDGSKKSDGG